MKEYIIENKELNSEINEIITIDDFYIFKNPDSKFNIEYNVNVSLKELNNTINNIICLTSNKVISNSELISNGYDICLIKNDDKLNLAIRYLSGRIINIFEVPKSLSMISLNIFISHYNGISTININNVSNKINIFNSDNTIIKLGGQQNMYGQPYNTTHIYVKKFKIELA